MHQTEQYNWDFLFLGADQDAVLTASQLASIFRRAVSGRCDGLRITVWG